MPSSPLARKLQIKPGFRVLIRNAPEDLDALLRPLPDDVELSDDLAAVHDLVLLFVLNTAGLEIFFSATLAALKEGGVLWISYPKSSAKAETDLSRDRGWEIVAKAGLRPVSQVSIDQTWSALRFSARELVGR